MVLKKDDKPALTALKFTTTANDGTFVSGEST
jgi:hypothetical protein